MTLRHAWSRFLDIVLFPVWLVGWLLQDDDLTCRRRRKTRWL
jgi:hypothetical protein